MPQQGWMVALRELHVHQGCEEQRGHVLPAHKLGHWGRGHWGAATPRPMATGASTVPDAALRTQPVLQRGHGPENVITQYELLHR